MSIQVSSRHETPVISIKGRFLGSLHGEQFQQAVNDLRQAGHAGAIVDLSRTDFMDSSGIGALIAALNAMREAGGDMRLAAVESRVKNVFTVTHLLGKVFRDYETVEEAVESFRTHPAPLRPEA
jgi:anti-sigma B factor antagonist